MIERPPVELRVAALVSGLDSCVMVGLLARDYSEITPIYVRAGFRWEDAEVEALNQFFSVLGQDVIRPIVEVRLGVGAFYGTHWSTAGMDVPDAHEPDEAWYLPGRNLALLSTAAVYGGTHAIQFIAIGILGSNPFPDATEDFFRSLEKTAGLAMNTTFHVLTPLHGMHKPDVIQAGSVFPLEVSLSCASPVQGKHCGVCGKCGERRRGFIEAGIYDPTDYVGSIPL